MRAASAVLLGGLVALASAAPAPRIQEHTETIYVPDGTSNNGTAASTDGNPSFYLNFTNPDVKPEPIRGGLGATILSGTDEEIDRQNPDLLARPATDVGTVMNAKWPLSLSSNRIEDGGWARQENVDVLPIATQMAGVQFRLKPGAYRELHWHQQAEWSYMLNGSATIAVVNTEGKNYVRTVNKGDLWYFPAGIPHSIQAQDPDIGCEFLLVFDDGTFNEDDTFLITDWLAHIPQNVLKKNFGLGANSTAFNDIPGSELYVFEGPQPPPVEEQMVQDINGTSAMEYTLAFSKMEPMQVAGGTVKIADSETNFPIAKTIAAAEITIQPGGMRELHWHPNSDEWDYFIKGEFRVTLFAAGTNSRTFNYQAGDVGYIPTDYGHYLECISKESCQYLEIFRAPVVADIPLSAWLANTPRHIVTDTLRISNATWDNFPKQRQWVVPGNVYQS